MGYDTADFYGEVPPDFICSICLDVMRNPVMLKTCQHTYCDYCIKLLPYENRRCPQDRSPFDDSAFRAPYPFFVTLHQKLPIKCEFWPDCQEKLSLKDKESHESQCDNNPLNNIICQNYCGQKLTMASLDNHDCFEYFTTKIQQLKEANEEFKKKNDQLQNENKELKEEIADLKSKGSLHGTKPRERNDKPEQAKPKVIVEASLMPQVTINYSKYGTNITSQELLRKFKRMVEVVQSFDRPIHNADAWVDSGLFSLLSQLFDDNENAKNILTLTDLRSLFTYKYRLLCFSNVFNKANSRVLLHMLLFDVLEPLISSNSKVLLIDYIEYGVTQLLAQKVQHVTTATNPKFMESLLKNTHNFGAIASKIHFVPYQDKIEDLITKVTENSHPHYDFILSFERLDCFWIKHLLRQLCPFGTFLGYHSWRYEIKKCRLTSNSLTGIELEIDILARSSDLEELNLGTYGKAKNTAGDIDDSAWRGKMPKGRRNRLPSAKFCSSNIDLSGLGFELD